MTRFSIFILVVGFITLTASVPVSESAPKALDLKHRDLVGLAENAKGQKLTFKEKVALRVFGKKIQTISKTGKSQPQGESSQLVALLLAVFLGGFGVHRFYLGYTWQGVVQLLTVGGCGIWALIDIIRIVTGSLGPNGSNYSKTL